MNDFVIAECGIRQLHARFVDAVWRQDFAAFADCFASDGIWKIAGFELTGRDEIREQSAKMLSRCEWIQLITQTPILEVTGDTAIGRQPMVEFARMPDGSGAMTIGYYHDHYVLEDGQWRFRKRHWSMKYRGPSDLSGLFAGTSDYGAFPAMPAPDEATYVRPA